MRLYVSGLKARFYDILDQDIIIGFACFIISFNTDNDQIMTKLLACSIIDLSRYATI